MRRVKNFEATIGEENTRLEKKKTRQLENKQETERVMNISTKKKKEKKTRQKIKKKCK